MQTYGWKSIIQYSAVGISQFDLNASVHSQSIVKAKKFMGQGLEDALILQVISKKLWDCFGMSEPFETTLSDIKGGSITDLLRFWF